MTKKIITLRPNVPQKRKFFLDTLDISAQFVNTTMTKVTSAGTVEPEKKTLPPSTKLSNELKNSIRQHITKFPTMPSHYCRKDINQQYLQQGLNVAELYRLYKEDRILPSAKC